MQPLKPSTAVRDEDVRASDPEPMMTPGSMLSTELTLTSGSPFNITRCPFIFGNGENEIIVCIFAIRFEIITENS